MKVRSSHPVFAILVALSLCSCLYKSSKESQQQPAPSPTASQRPLPARTGSISDYANVFDPAEEKRLELLSEELRRDTEVESAILTVDTTHEQSMFDFSLAVARDWKLGGANGRGFLLVLAIKDRQWRLQVSRALEGDLPDDVSKQLAEPSVELYKQGKYAEGVDRYIRAISDRLRQKK